MVEFRFEHIFHDLNYFELEFFFLFLEFIIYLRASSQNFVENHQLNVNLSIFLTILLKKITCSISPIFHPLAPFSQICKLFGFFLDMRNRFLGFADQYAFYIYIIYFFYSQKSKLVYSFESLPLDTR